jgi:hypothetical protein
MRKVLRWAVVSRLILFTLAVIIGNTVENYDKSTDTYFQSDSENLTSIDAFV